MNYYDIKEIGICEYCGIEIWNDSDWMIHLGKPYHTICRLYHRIEYGV